MEDEMENEIGARVWSGGVRTGVYAETESDEQTLDGETDTRERREH